jgi:hypothetical protein
VNLSLRGIRKLQGVASQLKPLEVLTCAWGGEDSTVNFVVVPRVTVAHAPSELASAHAAAAVKICFLNVAPG